MKSANFVAGKVHHQIGKPESPFVSMRLLHRSLIIAVIVIYLLFVGVQGRFSPTPTSASSWVFLALTVNLSLLLVPVIFYKSSYGWFHPLIFGVFIALINHSRKIALYINGLQFHVALPAWSSEELTLLVAYSLALSSVGLVVYYFGFFFGPSFGVPRVTFSQPRYVGLKTLLVLMFSILVFAAYMQTRGGIVAHIISWGRGRTKELAGQFYWDFFIEFSIVAYLIWLATDRKAHLQPIFWGCAVTSLGINFLATGSRSSVIYSIILGLLVWQLRDRKIAVNKLLISVVLSLVILAVLGNFRNSTFTGEVNWNTLTGSSPSGSIFSTATNELEERSSSGNGIIPVLALVPDQVNFLYGSSYLAVLTLPIPRGWWPEKPGLVGGLVGNTFFGGTTGGVPPGAVGEAFWNFGIPGVLVVFFLFGAFHRWLAKAFRQYASEPAAVVLYAITLYVLDPSGPGVQSWLFSIIPALVLLCAVGAISFRQVDK